MEVTVNNLVEAGMNTAQGGYHYMAANPYAAIVIIVLAVVIGLGLLIGIISLFTPKKQIELADEKISNWKYAEVKTTKKRVVKGKKKKATKKKK